MRGNESDVSLTFVPATDSLVPPAEGHTRQITRHIRTNVFTRGWWICATYTRVETYTNPHEAPIYARMRPTNIGKAGKWSGHWDGEIVIQTFARTETAALAALLESLDELQLYYDRQEARDILVAMACTTEATDWALRPLGVRGQKARAKRLTWRDENGKQVHVYPTTLRRHADPDCPCEHCTADRQSPTKKTTTK